MSGTFSPNPAANTLGIAMFDAAYYLSSNPDVLAAVTKGGITAQQHFVQFGRFEGRNPTAFFNTEAYVAANPDVANVLGTQPGFTAWDHFINYGVAENRGTGAFEGNFDAQAYLDAYPDVAAAVASGVFRSAFEHFIEYGIVEDREGYTTEGESLNPNFPNVPIEETFALTTGVDVFTGDAVDDVFNAQLALGIDGLVGVQTLQGPDVLDGGAGVNILNAELNGTGTTSNPTISNIQQYYLTSYAGVLGSGMLDLSRATGYEQLWNRDSRVDLQLDSVGEVAILGMDNVRGGSTYEVNYDNIAVETQVVVATRSGQLGERVELEINGVLGDITNLELNVSNGVFLNLDNDAADIANLTIAGTGPLDLTGEDQFANLQTLDATGYNEDLTLDISGGGSLTSVLTGDGDDVITASAATFSADTPATTLDLGLGDNRLVLEDSFETQPVGTYTGGGVIDSDELSALDFTLAPVSNVQTLELVDVELGGNASLNLDGVGGLETLVLPNFENLGGDDLFIDNAPADLTITTAEEIEMNGGLFTIEGVVNLAVTSTGLPGDDSDIRLDGGVNSTTLETLSIEAADDAELDLEGTTDPLTTAAGALTTVNVVALGDDADVDIIDGGALGDDAEFAALTTVNVTAKSDATLNMAGIAGVAFFAGTQATQSFAIDVSAAGFPSFTAAGNVFFTSGDLAAGFVDTNYSAQTFAFQPLDAQAADDIASGLDATAELEASSTFFSNVVNVTWADVGSVSPLTYNAGASGATLGTLNSVIPGLFTDGTPEVPMVAGQGFEALAAVVVDAQGGDANVTLTDVYGAFTLDVTATDDANVNLFNTNATSVTVTAGTGLGDTATVTVGGDTVGNAELVTLTVSGDRADVTLSDDLSSFTTLDVSGVVTNLVADTSGAEFVVGAGQFIEYLIGATSDGDDLTVDVDFTGNLDAREVYNFVGGDIGNVVITGFTAGADPVADRLDLSDFANGAGQLVFTQDGADVVISDIAGGVGDFEGTITIVGATAADLAFNILYA